MEDQLFTPFDTQLEAVTVQDLERLRGVAEGWYVEYKSQVSNAADVAKSISALANTYGGWIFYGVEEKSKAEPVAGSFPGIDDVNADAVFQRIRQAVAQNMNPAAHFDLKAVRGDGSSLPLGRMVICIRVPQSPTAPHVHVSGRIYRRVADGSEPKPENDRHLLEQMFKRSDQYRKQFSNWVERDPEFSKGEEDLPYLRLLMDVDPWDIEKPWLETNAAELKKIFSQEDGLFVSLPFDTLYTSSRGFVARQVNSSDPHRLGLTWHFRGSLISEVIIPLNFYEEDDPRSLLGPLRGYECGKEFIKFLVEKNYSSPRIVDINILFWILIAVVGTQQRLLKAANWDKSYFVKARLLNVWRTVAFLDVDVVVDSFKDYGLPVCLDRVVTTPLGTEPDSFWKMDQLEDIEKDEIRLILQALAILRPIATAWGLPFEFDHELDPPLFLRLYSASERAIKIQQRKAAMNE